MLSCWAAVPCFFMATGAIFLNREFDFKKWIKRLIKTYIVLIIWNIIYLIFFVLWKDISLNEISKFAILKYIFMFQNLPKIQSGHMWFINAYISVLLVYPIVLMCLNSENLQFKKFLKILFMILVFASFVAFDINIILENIGKILNKNIANFITLGEIKPFGMYSNALAFFIIGGIFYRYKISDKYSKNKIIIFSILGMGLGLLGLILIRYSSTHTFTWDGKYLTNGYNYISTLVLSISIFAFFQTIDLKTNKGINVISQNTLGIFYIHVIILNLIGNCFKTSGIFYNFLKTIIVLLISTVLCYVMKKIKWIKEIF